MVLALKILIPGEDGELRPTFGAFRGHLDTHCGSPTAVPELKRLLDNRQTGG